MTAITYAGGATLADLLNQLGDTPDTVAATLRHAGVRGVPGEPCKCPVAVWLERHGVPEPWVDDPTHERLVWVSANGDCADMPAPVAGFIEAMDGWRYPDLEADNA